MDSKRFDNLTKCIGTRRNVLAALGLGSIAGLFGTSAVEAKPKCRNEGKPCEGNNQCCDDLSCFVGGGGGEGNAERCGVCDGDLVTVDGTTTCVPTPPCETECCSDDDCDAADVCVEGICVCPNGAECCENTACPGDEICFEGECVTEPPVDPCDGVECPEGEVCKDGTCVVIPKCPPGKKLCKGKCINKKRRCRGGNSGGSGGGKDRCKHASVRCEKDSECCDRLSCYRGFCAARNGDHCDQKRPNNQCKSGYCATGKDSPHKTPVCMNR